MAQMLGRLAKHTLLLNRRENMGIDMSKMRERLTTLNQRGEKGKNNFWRPKDGDTTIRIVPTEDGDPFRDFWFHYNVGKNAGFMCPKKNFGDDCPVCDFVRKLYNDGDEDSVKMAKSLNARQRFFSPVVVREGEDDRTLVWGYGRTAYQDLLNLVLNPDYGDITDPDEGTDLVITYGKAPGAQFPQTSITPRRKSSALHEDSDRAAEYMNGVPDFTELFDKKSAEDVQAMLDEYLLGGEEESSASESTTTEKSSSSEGDSVDAAFSELVGA